MTEKEVKECLRAYRRAFRRCGDLKKEISGRRSAMRGLRAVRTDSLPGGGGNSLEASIEKLDTLERRLMEAEMQRDAVLADVRALIDKADEPCGKSILLLRYIDGVRFEDIPDRLYISYATMWRKYNRTIEEIVRKSKNDSE